MYVISSFCQKHSWARTPQILRAGGVYYIKYVRYKMGSGGWGGGGLVFITLTPCVPRYGQKIFL